MATSDTTCDSTLFYCVLFSNIYPPLNDYSVLLLKASATEVLFDHSTTVKYCYQIQRVDAGGPVVIILAIGSEVRGFKSGRGRWIFSERKNPDYDFLRKGSKAVGPMLYIYGT